MTNPYIYIYIYVNQLKGFPHGYIWVTRLIFSLGSHHRLLRPNIFTVGQCQFQCLLKGSLGNEEMAEEEEATPGRVGLGHILSSPEIYNATGLLATFSPHPTSPC